ncbi:MAG: hypothetical protein PHG03_02370 [Bacilli bacterium]|nr:hypothetical protein [Bacilli bacterium]MDD4795385.1 hypothetical protein [Bacilli bacterium]
MKKYISLMNAYTFYYIWNSEYQFHIKNLINEILEESSSYNLLETINDSTKNLRSYIFLESSNKIIYIDFNKEDHNLVLDNALVIFNYLKTISDKEIILILFNAFTGTSKINNNIYQIYKDNNNEFLKLLFSSNFKEQSKTNLRDLFNYIYNLDDKFYLAYLKEEKLKDNIYKS